MKLEKLKRDLETFQRELPESLAQIARRNQAVLKKLNTQDQLLNKGIRSDGTTIEPDYTPFTKAIKRRKGQPTDRVTLKDTGKFHRGWKVIAGKKQIQFFSTDSKTMKLVDKYGKNIFGLTRLNIELFSRTIVLPELQRQIRRITQ